MQRTEIEYDDTLQRKVQERARELSTELGNVSPLVARALESALTEILEDTVKAVIREGIKTDWRQGHKPNIVISDEGERGFDTEKEARAEVLRLAEARADQLLEKWCFR